MLIVIGCVRILWIGYVFVICSRCLCCLLVRLLLSVMWCMIVLFVLFDLCVSFMCILVSG